MHRPSSSYSQPVASSSRDLWSDEEDGGELADLELSIMSTSTIPQSTDIFLPIDTRHTRKPQSNLPRTVLSPHSWPLDGEDPNKQCGLDTPQWTSRCVICMDDYELSEIVHPACQHQFCRDCLQTYANGKLKEKRFPVSCPVCLMNGTEDNCTYTTACSRFADYLND